MRFEYTRIQTSLSIRYVCVRGIAVFVCFHIKCEYEYAVGACKQ